MTMTIDRALQLLQIERECVRRQSGRGCDRDCQTCDIVQATEELIAMYDYVMQTLGYIKSGGIAGEAGARG